jgi:tRNA threonylcarbamoyladenosine biosynthesis protein TsaE
MSGTPEQSETAPDAGFLARGQAETEAAGRELASLVKPGDLILVSGEVGAGKSTLVRSALRQIGVEGAIPSPTFTIGRLYLGPGQRFPVSHLDLYRLGGLGDEDPGLLAEYLGPDRVALVEWPGGAEGELSEMATRVGRVAIDHVDSESRRIRIQPPA